MRALLASTLLLAGCGLGMMGGQEPPLPQVSTLALQADGTETLQLTWAEGDVPRAMLERTTITAGQPWLTSTTTPGDDHLTLCFAKGFSQAMAGHGAWVGAVTLPEDSPAGMCRCCRHGAHVIGVRLTFDGAGTVSDAFVSQDAR